jgi:hypothetical protein
MAGGCKDLRVSPDRSRFTCITRLSTAEFAELSTGTESAAISTIRDDIAGYPCRFALRRRPGPGWELAWVQTGAAVRLRVPSTKDRPPTARNGRIVNAGAEPGGTRLFAPAATTRCDGSQFSRCIRPGPATTQVLATVGIADEGSESNICAIRSIRDESLLPVSRCRCGR